MVGYQYTWERSRGKHNWVAERLDRALASLDWIQLFSDAWVQNVAVSRSDHSLLVVHCSITEVHRIRPFRFENSWRLNEECRRIVADKWQVAGSVIDKLRLIAETLSIWGRRHHGDFRLRLQYCRKELEDLRLIPGWYGADKFVQKKTELGELIAQKDVYWKQRAKKFWLEGADQNTKYFHMSASSRRRKNNFQRLCNERDEWVTWGNGPENLIQNHFNVIFQSQQPDFEAILDLVQPKLNPDQINSLVNPFARSDIKEVVFSMNPNKSPGDRGRFDPIY